MGRNAGRDGAGVSCRVQCGVRDVPGGVSSGPARANAVSVVEKGWREGKIIWED